MNIELVLIGLIIGMFIGISGVGGGSIMTPVLILVLGINPLVAVGTDLLYSVPTKILAAFVHARQRTIEWRIVWALLWGGIPGVVAGVILLIAARHYFDFETVTKLVKMCVGIALFICAAALLLSLLLKRTAESSAEDPAFLVEAQGTRAKLIASGAGVGFLVAVTSVGSGAMTLPLLFLIVPFVGIRRLVGSDIVFAAFLIPAAALGHATLGDVNYRVALTLLAGSLPGAYIGSKLCNVLSEVWLRPMVAAVLIIAGSRLV
ncbi:MAG TPA: sulfite exporter TauE/SafE family protein [Candidatus Rubrimentiphilum sp.]|nr:sulfite exporter TauE/SafE family protein [Candidatus Rubrimentiphilum sp.]